MDDLDYGDNCLSISVLETQAKVMLGSPNSTMVSDLYLLMMFIMMVIMITMLLVILVSVFG